MRAMFVTTRTSDCTNHVNAWASFAPLAARVIYTPNGVPNDISILETAKQTKPDVIFYIGAVSGSGLPRHETFCALRRIAPMVHLCSDAADRTWHKVLKEYRALGCFDLQVSIDGVGADVVDHVTVTPIDPRPFSGPGPDRKILCGFSGGFGSRFPFDYENHDSAYRGRALHVLQKHKLLIVRRRDKTGPYEDHVIFMRRCKIALNLSLCGSAEAHQVKGRVLEAGWAGCALLESAGSPAIKLFPGVLVFETVGQAREILRGISDSEIKARADIFGRFICENYHPRKVYGGILEKLNVVPSFARAAP